MSSPEATDTERGQAKGSNDSGKTDPSGGFESGASSAAAAAAQQTLEEIDPDNDDGVDIANQDSFSAETLQDDANLEQIAEKYGLTDRQAEMVQTLAENDLSPDAPESVNLDSATEFEPMAGKDDTGVSDSSMWIARTDDGGKMYLTFYDQSVAGNPVRAGGIYDSVQTALSDEMLDKANMPDFNVDMERKALVIEGVGEGGKPFGRYFRSDDVSGFDKDNLLHAYSMKLLAGDTDTSGNILATPGEGFSPIDFDAAGSDLETRDDYIADDDGYDAEHDGIIDKKETLLIEKTEYFDFEVSEGDLRDTVQQMADDVDIDTLEDELVDAPGVSFNYRANIPDNIRTLRNDELG
jgi:hypothetical protein